MTGQQDRSKYQQGIIRRAYDHKDTIALQRLSEVVSDLYVAEGGKGVQKLWTSARIALVKLAPEDPRVAKVLASRDVSQLAKLVGELSSDARASKQDTSETEDGPTIQPGSLKPSSPPRPDRTYVPPPEDTSPPTPEECKKAMKAFRKRLKLKRLDDESKLGRSPLSGGKASQTIAIMAPREYRQVIWDELVKQGKLKKSGSFYELAD